MSYNQLDLFSDSTITPAEPEPVDTTTIPASPEHRKLLKEYIKEVSGYLDKIDKLKAEIKDVLDVVTDKNGKLKMPSKVFNIRVKAYREAAKLKEQVVDMQDALDDISLLNIKG